VEYFLDDTDGADALSLAEFAGRRLSYRT